MSVKLEKLLINGLYNKCNIEWNFNDSISVIVGDNGVGKSTILQILYCLLLPTALENNPKIISLFNSVELYLTNGYVIRFSTKNREMDPEMFNVLSRVMKDSELLEALNKNLNKRKKTPDQIKKIKKRMSEVFELINNINNQDISVIGKELIISLSDNEGRNIKISNLRNLFNVELVSTLFMSANSANEIKGSDGNVFTILDLEIDKQLSRLNSMDNNRLLKDTLIKKINDFLIDKKAQFIDGNLLFELDGNLGIIPISDLSSGERQLIYILLKSIILSDISSSQTSILIMDEPEISLHLSWQEKLLNCLYDINPNSQIIVATHSPAIVMDGWMNSYKDIKDIVNVSYE